MTPFKIRISCLIAVVLMGASGVISSPAVGQGVQRIAAIVNDDIVSMHDLQSRMRLVIASTGMRATPALQRRLAQQILRVLIDERLQLQEAKRRNVTATKRDMQRAYANLEKRNGIKPGSFNNFVRQNGLPRDAIDEQLRAQIVWQKLIRRTLLRRVTVGPEEIDETLERLKARKGEKEYRIAEILLTVEKSDQEKEVLNTASRLISQLKDGAQFGAVAQQMSNSASAPVGGDLGWIADTVIDADIAPLVRKMAKGAVAGPIKTQAGIRIIQLVDSRQVLASSPEETSVELRRIKLPLAATPDADSVLAQTNLARILAETVSDCPDFERAAEEASAVKPVSLGKRKLKDLSRTLRDTVSNLPINKASGPVREPDGVAIYMVCAREEPPSTLPSREEIETQLRNERVSNLARRFMRDLRNAAVVDVRT
jgi:peptidyl-prolyl cis-trans isomerase SurA